jgi:hypothetical protein
MNKVTKNGSQSSKMQDRVPKLAARDFDVDAHTRRLIFDGEDYPSLISKEAFRQLLNAQMKKLGLSKRVSYARNAGWINAIISKSVKPPQNWVQTDAAWQ